MVGELNVMNYGRLIVINNFERFRSLLASQSLYDVIRLLLYDSIGGTVYHVLLLDSKEVPHTSTKYFNETSQEWQKCRFRD